MHVRHRWQIVMGRYGADTAAIDAGWRALADAYAEPWRHYHTLAHLEALFALVDAHRPTPQSTDTLALAIFYHDAVYDPRRSDNETQSAELARARLPTLGVSQDDIARVVHLIDMTRHGAAEPRPGDLDLDHFLDFDLAILAASRGEYDAYAEAIRREYAHVPPAAYVDGRARVLQAFLARPALYRVPALQHLWEATARANLVRELLRLQAPTG